MKEYRILFLVGNDRPGIVDDLSAFLYQRNANIEDSRMAALGGKFAIMTLFSCSGEHLQKIQGDLAILGDLGFEVSVHEAADPEQIAKRPEIPLKLEVISMDHPGIVQKVVHILHHYGISINSLDTQVIRAPLSGAPLFDLKLEAGVPQGVTIAKVKEELTALARKENLDLTFSK